MLFADIGSKFSEEGKQVLGSSAKTSRYWEYVPNAMRLSLAKSSLYIHICICIGEGSAILSGWQGSKDSEIFRTVLDHSDWSTSPSFCSFFAGMKYALGAVICLIPEMEEKNLNKLHQQKRHSNQSDV